MTQELATADRPFQLHVGGALPRGRNQAWAESPAGIEYALREIGKVAGGLHGQSAISNIVSRFERPKDPRSEIARALASYGKVGGGDAAAVLAAPKGQQDAPAPNAAPDLRMALASQLASGRQIDWTGLAAQQQQAVSRAASTNQDVRHPAGVAPPPSHASGSSQFTMTDAEGAPDAHGVRHHAAYDWMLGGNAPVPALLGGTVIEAKPSSGDSGQIYGGTVKIQTPDGRVLVYRHVNPNVKVGQKVAPGMAVAHVVRWRDNPSSSHTHTELWKTKAGGYRYENMADPLPLIPR